MTSPAFSHAEYTARQQAVRTSMASSGIDTLVVTEPANMCYLTGYDGWSFYTPQCLLVALSLDEPVLIDTDAAAAAVWPYTWMLQRVGDKRHGGKQHGGGR